ncbi:hypothetical protein U1Q18_012966 [Sarracenia purpurea var. burkii]
MEQDSTSIADSHVCWVVVMHGCFGCLGVLFGFSQLGCKAIVFFGLLDGCGSTSGVLRFRGFGRLGFLAGFSPRDLYACLRSVARKFSNQSGVGGTLLWDASSESLITFSSQSFARKDEAGCLSVWFLILRRPTHLLITSVGFAELLVCPHYAGTPSQTTNWVVPAPLLLAGFCSSFLLFSRRPISIAGCALLYSIPSGGASCCPVCLSLSPCILVSAGPVTSRAPLWFFWFFGFLG